MSKIVRYCYLLSVFLLLPISATDAFETGQIQKRLVSLGFDSGPVDGIPGSKTRSAIEQFQKKNNLPATGLVDQETEEYLFPDLVLYTQPFEPFHYPHPLTGKLAGPAVELIQRACRDAMLRCVLKLGEGTWKETQEKVKAGSGDGLFLIGWNKERAEYLQSTENILNTEYGFFARSTNHLAQKYTDISDLKGYVIGVYGPSNTSNTLDKLLLHLRDKGYSADKYQTDDDDDVFRKFKETNFENYIVFSNRDVGNSIIKRLGLENIRYIGRYRCVSYVVGITTRHNSIIIQKFNTALRKLEENGYKQAIFAPYDISLSCGESLKYQQAPVSLPDPGPLPSPAKKCDVKVINEKSIVECSDTCLQWQQSGSESVMSLAEANGYIRQLNANQFASFNDWRLPTADEFKTLFTQEGSGPNSLPIPEAFNTLQVDCWTSDQESTGKVIYVDFLKSAFASKNADSFNYVRAVRGKSCQGNNGDND